MVDAGRSTYHEWAPAPELAPWVACYWRQDIAPDGGAYPQRVLPDGSVDVVILPTGAIVAGPATHAVVTPLPAGATHGIRFRPGAADAVLGFPATEVLDTDVSLEDAWPSWRAGDEAVTAHVMRRIRSNAPDPLVAEAVRRLHHGGARVSELADDLGVSDRHLRRRFHVAVGYAPKTLDRVLRFQRFLEYAEEAAPSDDLARAAALAGYADQAHLTRDCGRLAGVTPTELLALRAAAD